MEKGIKTNQKEENESIPGKEVFSSGNVLQNLKDYFGFKTNLELAELLGVKPNTISTWKKRNSVDYQRLITIGKVHGIDFNKLFSHDVHEQNSIVVVPIALQYLYVSQREDQGFISSLPRYQFPFSSGKDARVFQVTNLSSFSDFKGMSYVAGNRIHDLKAVVEGNMYVFVSREHGVLIGRVERESNTEDIIYMVSGNNKALPPTKIKMAVKNIMEIWKVNDVIFHDLIS